MALRRQFEHAKTASGAALATLGMFFLYSRVDRAATYVKDLLGAQVVPGQPAIIVAASRMVQASLPYRHGVLEVLGLQMLISAWPLLLIVAGTILSRDQVEKKIDVSKKS